MPIKVFHNPRCRKSREGLAFLQNKGLDLEVVDYIKKGISREDLKEIVLKLNVKPGELVRQNEEYFRKQLKGLVLSDEEWITVISENPSLLRRPVILTRHSGVIGDPVENITKIL
jgi:arsenate reductase (glutaredoxin)